MRQLTKQKYKCCQINYLIEQQQFKYMEALTLTNFKSYKKHSLIGFSPYINIIMGGNGQGKSNIFKALSFVLSDKLQLNRTQFNNCLHRGVDLNNQSEIQIEVIIRDKISGGQLVKVGKLWKANLNEQCYVNSKLTNKKQYENFIESLCISYSNPYNIIQQGKINQITLMDQFQLYKLLEEITGAKKFNKRKQQALAIMKKIELEKQDTKTVLAQLNEKLKSLENKKQEFQFFSVEQKTKKYRTKKHLTELLEGTRHNLQKIKSEYSDINESYSKIISKKKHLYEEMEEGTIFIKNAKQKMILIDKSTQSLGPVTQIMQTQEAKNYEQKQKQVNKELKEYAKKMRQKDQLINAFKKQFSQVQQNFQSMKLSKQVNNPNESREKIITAYNLEIKSEEEALKKLQEQKQKLVSKVEDLEKALKNKKNTEIQLNSEKLQKESGQIKQKMQLNKRELCQLNWQRNVQNIECQSLKEVIQQSQVKIRKYLPYLDFTLMDQLKQAKVKGVYGYFLQFVKIDENVRFAYEIAGINKLCSILVEDQQACSAVIDMNRKIKGKQVNIIQLNYIRSKPADSQSAPKSDNVKKLANSKWIKVDLNAVQEYQDSLAQDIEKLIKNTFAKYALVKDYQTGLKASKQYHLNCITSEKQIIYSEGYHCKLGQQNIHQQSNLQMFYKFEQKRQMHLKKIKGKKQIQARILELENQEISLMNSHQKNQVETNRILNHVNQIKTQRKMLEIYKKNIDQMDKNYHDNEISINKKKQAIKSISSKNTKGKDNSKWTKAECQKIEDQYHKKRKHLNKMLTQVFEIEQIMQKLTSEKEQIDNKVISARNNKAAGIVDPNIIALQIDNQLQLKERQIKKLEAELEDMNKAQKEIEADKNHIEIKLITYRSQQEDLLNKLNQIGEIEENIEELQELSHSMSVSNLHGRKKNHFSAKDKLLFNKFGNILQSFAAHKKTFQELEQAEEKINRTIVRYQNESELYLTQTTQRFEKEFIDIFGFLVNQGNAEVRFKKVSEKIKEVIKYKNCLTVKVSFSRQSEPMKKWNDFSGGEKTVVAISIILALQRCEPAPFYVLDQIDSALDSVYVQKIAELLARESQRNKSQYFISTFKQDMLNFPDEICNYYLVTCQNRVSEVEKIRKNKTVDILRSITMRK